MYSRNGVFIPGRPARVDTTLDLGGGFVVPPFADAHTHNLDGAANLDSVRNMYVREGVYYVQVLTNSRARAAQVRDRFNRPCDLDVRYAHGGLTSTLSHPFLAYEPRAMGLYDGSQWRTRAADVRKSRLRLGDAYWFLDSLADIEAQWPLIFAGQPDVIKIFLLDAREEPPVQPDTGLPNGQGLRPSLVPQIVLRAHAAGLRVAAHVETANDARIAVESGVDILAHLPGYEMAFGADRRRYEIDSATARLAGRRGVVATPTLSLADIDDGSGPIAELAAARRRLQRENIRLLLASGVRIAVGSDWFGRTATKEFEELASTGLWSTIELIRLWGEETSLAVFPDRRIGRLEPGYEASFLVLRDDPSRSVIALRSITLRVKQGCLLAETAPSARGQTRP
jgi:imidazolonepropionase-like amidohydrolase